MRINAVPVTSKNGTLPLSISVMYNDENMAAIIISAMHHVRYICVDIFLYRPTRYSHPRVMDIDTNTMQKSIVTLNAKPACSIVNKSCMLRGL